MQLMRQSQPLTSHSLPSQYLSPKQQQMHQRMDSTTSTSLLLTPQSRHATSPLISSHSLSVRSSAGLSPVSQSSRQFLLQELPIHSDYRRHPTLPFGSDTVIFRSALLFVDSWTSVTQASPLHTLYTPAIIKQSQIPDRAGRRSKSRSKSKGESESRSGSRSRSRSNSRDRKTDKIRIPNLTPSQSVSDRNGSTDTTKADKPREKKVDDVGIMSSPSDYVMATQQLHPILIRVPRVEGEKEVNRTEGEEVPHGPITSSAFGSSPQNKSPSKNSGNGNGSGNSNSINNGLNNLHVPNGSMMTPARKTSATNGPSQAQQTTPSSQNSSSRHSSTTDSPSSNASRTDSTDTTTNSSLSSATAAALLPLCLFPCAHRPVFVVYHRFWEDDRVYRHRVNEALKWESLKREEEFEERIWKEKMESERSSQISSESSEKNKMFV